ncbi:MAG: peptidoglycan-associated lipoprotein [Rhodospirillaceae bacterium]|nr:peptidoglycan-associated lipoprotein [Rhodospirillaceae bacterium]
MTGPGSVPVRVLSSVYFELDQASIDPAEREKLRESANLILDNPAWNILIEGHCDWRGTSEYNIGLGDRRANSVKEYLISLGIPSGRVETRSKGDLESTPEGTEEEMSYDRRADLFELQ